MRNLSLRAKLLLIFLAIALIPPLVTGAIATNLTSDLSRQRLIVDEQARLETLDVEIERFLDTTLSDLRVLSQTSTMRSLADAIKDKKTLQLQILRQQVEQEFTTFMSERRISDQLVYEHVRFLNINGFEFVRIDNVDGEVLPASGASLNTRAQNSYFRDALELPDNSIVVSPIVIFDEFGRIPENYTPVMRYSIPIRSGDTLVGVLVTDVRAAGFLDLVNRETSPDTITYMVDQTGMYIAHPDASKLFGSALETNANLTQDEPDMAFLLQGQQSSYSVLHDSLVFYRAIQPPGAQSFYWVVVSERPLSSVSSIAQQQASVLTISLLVIVVIVGILAVLVSRLISRPIVELTQTAQSIAGGSYNQQVRVSNRDEIGKLQTSVNSMATQIKQSIDTLEERVRERTSELEEARRVAESANSAKSEFLSNMSHELRTPLNMVIGYTSSMLNMPQMYDYIPLPEIYRKDIEVIQDNGQHLLGLINDILDLSKIEAGKLDLQNQPVNLNEIFRGVVATSVGLINDKPVQIRPNYPDTLPAVWGDSLRIRQILLNLLSNAIKFTDTGYVTLSAHLEGDTVQIAVSDTGVGIPEDSLKVIFDRFAQIQSKASMQGTGLGLDIAQRLVQMHGGDLTAESKVGVGSTFRFSLPIAKLPAHIEPEEWHPSIADTRPTKPEVVDWMALRTILLVVDDSMLRASLHRILEDANYVVFETSHPAEVQEFAISLTVDLIVMDGDLPARSGFDLLKDLRTHDATRAIPIVLLTSQSAANGSNGSGRGSSADGDLPHTIKQPLRAADLLEKVRDALAKVTN